MKTKLEAEYIDQSPTRKCRDCTMFKRPDSCTIVSGKISPEGHCHYFERKGDSS